MMFSSILAATTMNSLSTLYQQTFGRLRPINIDNIPGFRQQTVIDDFPDISCPTNPPLSTSERTVFGTQGCIVYCYPSTGGVLIKNADLVDMLFLSLPRSHISQRSPNADEEDRFCALLRRTGAKWWSSREDVIDALMGMRDMTEEEETVLEFGWPTDGVGAWVLRFASEDQLPRDFGRLRLAMDMEEKLQIMIEYGATFVEDVTQVEELYPKHHEVFGN